MRQAASILLIALFAITTSSFAISSPYTISPDSIYHHISVLADDSLEGREVGEIGEWKTALYISRTLKACGLEPGGPDNSYFQPFDFIKRIDPGEKNRLTVNGTELELSGEFIPMLQSASMAFDFSDIVSVNYGITVDSADGDYDDYRDKDVAGKAVLIKLSSPPAADYPHVNFDKYSSITDKINAAVFHEASAIFFIASSDKEDTLKTPTPAYIQAKDIPIVFLRREGLRRLNLDPNHLSLASIIGETELIRTRDTGYNVVARLPVENDTVVLMGAHYDHLGWGGPASLYRGDEKLIHNGADDNASGTAALLELARFYAAARDQLKYSMVFVAFSGEEAGVLGSTYCAKNMEADSAKVRMMINLDMIGRLKEQDKGLAIMGTGTCLEFKDYFDSLSYDDVKLALKESGAGPSDHTPFYNRRIPSLSFFTGPHKDYHKPSDDIEMIDADGIVRVTEIVRDVIDEFDRHAGPLTFQKTKDSGEGKHRSSFSVTLGIMPDYMAEVKGLRVDGVMPERPGDKAGLLEGDIVIRMGEIVIGDIYDYMNALGKFRAGDSTAVLVERGSDTLTLNVVF